VASLRRSSAKRSRALSTDRQAAAALSRPGELFDATNFLKSLTPNDLSFEIGGE
jgi:hypothetical protein